MKKILFMILILALLPALVWAQLKNRKSPVNVKNEIVKPVDNNLLGISFIDFSKIDMSHSYSMSYASIGGKGISQSLYLNTMKYQLSNPLSLKLQWGIRSYPYNSFGNDNPLFKDGLFFSGAELNYRPSDKFYIKFQYNALPQTGYYGYPYRYRSSYLLDEEE